MTSPGVRQAVILAGGRGTRLRPLTDDRPKPMIAFHGRPFLEYLVAQMKSQGIEEIVMLLGYRGDVIRSHFEDGARWGVRIRYSATAVDDLTARRLLVAEPMIDDRFLMLYCDNYWPIDLQRHLERFHATGARALVTIYANDDGYTRDNVSVDAEGWVRTFDPTRSAVGLRGVEIGYGVYDRSVLQLLPADGDAQVEHALYPTLAAEGSLAAMVTRHRYYSVGSLERLSQTDRFLARSPTAVLDRDGVLNVKPPRAEYVRTAADFQWLPGSLDALRILREASVRVIVVSNQAGIARGAMTAEDLDEVHAAMRAQAEAAGGRIDAVYHCPHGWDDGCDCRKPRPGMLFQAQRDWALDLSRTPFVGDDERDGLAAREAGMPFLMVDGSRSLLDHARAIAPAAMAGVAP